MQMAGEMMIGIAVDDYVRDLPPEGIQQKGTKFGQAVDMAFRVPRRIGKGGGHPYGGRHVLRGRAEAALLLAPVDQGFDFRAFSDVEQADSLRPAELMGGQGEHVGPRILRQPGEKTDHLHRVGVDGHSKFMSQGHDFPDGLDGPHFVVGGHDGNELRIRPDGLPHVLRVDPAAHVRGDPGHLIALFFQEGAGVQQSGMLDGRGDQVSLSRPETGHHALDHPIVALAAAGGKIDLFRAYAHAPGNVPPRLLQPRLGPPSGLVEAGRVPPAFPEAFGHRRKRRLRQRRRRRVIQINPSCLHPNAFFPKKIVVKNSGDVKI